MRTLTDVFVPGAPTLPEGLRTLAVSPERELEPGMTVRASFTFRNQGGATATGVRVRFNLPEGLVYLVGSGQLDDEDLDDEHGNSPLLARSGADIGDVAPGEERRIDIAYSVAGAIENGSTVELQAAVAAFEVPPVGSNIVRLVARSRPALANALTNAVIESSFDKVKSGGGARPGGEATITVKVHNAGESSAHDVVVVAPPPEHSSYIPNSARVNGREFERELLAPFDRVHAPMIATALPAGATATLQYRVRVEDPLPDGTVLLVRPQIASQETPAFDLEPAGLTVHAQPDFSDERTAFSVDPPERITPGSRAVLRLGAHNCGTTKGSDVSVLLSLPEQLVPVRGAFRIDGKPLRERKRETLIFDMGTIEARGSVEFIGEATLVAPIADGTSLPVEAVLRWNAGSGEPIPGERRFEHALTVQSLPYFSPRRNAVVSSGETIRHPSDECEASILITNDGTAAATGTIVHLEVGPGLEDVRAFERTVRLEIEGGSIQLGAVEPYASRKLTIRGRVRTPYSDRSVIRLGAMLECAQLDRTNLGEAVWRVDSHPVFSNDSSYLKLVADEVFRPNQLVDVDVRLRNEGTDAAGNVRLRLYISPEAKLESVEGATRDRTTLLFGDMAAGGSAEARLGVRLLRSLAKAHPVTIESLLTADAMLPAQLAPLTIVTTAEPNFSVGTLRSEPSEVADSGDEIEYVLHVRNSGDGPARRVKISADLLDTLIYVPNSTHVNGLPVRDAGAQSPLCSETGIALSDVDPGIEASIRWREVVHSGLIAGESIVRRVTMSYDGERVDEIVAEELKVRCSPAFANTIFGLPFGLDGMLGPAFGQRVLGDSGERLLQLPPAVAMSSAQHFSAVISLPGGSNGQPSQSAQETAGAIHTIVAFNADRLDRTLKFLGEARFGGLATHLFALRAFFADRAGAQSDESLHQIRLSLRETLDRLFIKLRLPNYVIAPRDLETPSLRANVLTLLENIQPAQIVDEPSGEVILRGSSDPVELHTLRDRVERAPIATAAPWSALARFLPNEDEPAANYRRMLTSSLDDLIGVDEVAFIDALQRRPYPVLDAALDVFLAQLTVRS